MKVYLSKHFVDNWLWLCPALAVVLAAAVLMAFGLNGWSAVLAALLLVCPVLILWGVIRIARDERKARRGHRN
jgi:predicted benzoate:H+ symporter BenE